MNARSNLPLQLALGIKLVSPGGCFTLVGFRRVTFAGEELPTREKKCL